MATTREQAEAYAYENRRQVTSLIRGADEALGDPRQRLNRSLAGGIAVGVLILAVFGVVGALGGGSGPGLPESRGAVVVAGSGSQYVVLNGVVHEALNLSSALLLGGPQLTPVRAEALEGARRGLPVGIPGAPDALPGNLTSEPWTICAVPSDSTAVPAQVRHYIGLPPPGDALSDTERMLLRAPDDVVWLVAEKRRHALRGSTLVQLGLGPASPISLPFEVIETIPEGVEIKAPDILDRGERPEVPVPGGADIGDVFTSDAGGGDQRYFVVQRDGVHPISELTYKLLLAAGSTTRTASLGELTRAPQAIPAPPNRAQLDAVPSGVRQLERDQPLCVSTRPGDSPGDAPWRVSLHTPVALPEPAGIRSLMSDNGRLTGLLEAVLIPSGSGALVRSTTSAGEDGAYTLITDSGQRYLIVSPEAVSMLDYDPDIAPAVPKPFVDLLPPGPDLDPEEAARKHIGSPR